MVRAQAGRLTTDPPAVGAPRPRAVLSAGTAFELVASSIMAADPSGRERFAEIEHWTQRMRALPAAHRRTLESVGQHVVINLLGLAAESPGERSATDFLNHIASLPAAEVVRNAAGRYRRAILRGVAADVIDDAVAGDAAARKSFLSMSWPDVPNWQRSLRFLLGASADSVSAALVEALQQWHDRVFAGEADQLAAAQGALVNQLRAESSEWRGETLLRRVMSDVDYVAPAGLETMLFVPVSSVRPLAIILDHRATTIFLFYVPEPAAPDAPPEQLVQLGKALADPLRLRALRLLAGGPHTLADLAAELGVPRTTLAHHIAVLRAAGLLAHTVEDGRWGRLSLRADAVADVEPLFRAFVTPSAAVGRSRRS